VLTEYVRTALSRQLCRDHVDKNNVIHAIMVDPEIEGVLRASIHDDPVEGRVVGMDPQTHEQVMKALQGAYVKAGKAGYAPLFLVSPHIRSVLFALLERDFGNVVVLSYNEIVPNVKVNEIATAVAA
jgi:flagellar biosynthesis protein FlhA